MCCTIPGFPWLMFLSNAIYLLRSLGNPILHPSRSRFLPSMDLRRVRKRQLLLRHHSSLEFGSLHPSRRHHLRRPQRRVGTRQPRTTRHRSTTGVTQCTLEFSIFLTSNSINDQLSIKPSNKIPRPHTLNRLDRII